jgi:hypothetical protein
MELEFNPGDPSRTIPVQLKAVPGILCRVVVPEGWANPDKVSLELLRNHPEGPPQLPISSETLQPIGLRRQVRFSGLEPGRFRLTAFVDFIPVAWQDVTLGEESLTVTLEVPDQDAGDFLVVHVFDPEGNAVRDVRLNALLYIDANIRHRAGSNRVLHRKDGSFWVRRPQPEDPAVPPGARRWLQIEANSPAYGIKTVVCADERAETVIRFAEPARLTVEVPGAGAVADRFNLRGLLYRKHGEDDMWLPAGEAGADFRRKAGEKPLEFGPLAPGRYRFLLGRQRDRADDGSTRRTDDFGLWEFDVASGPNRQVCPMPRLFTLTLAIADLRAVDSISLRRVERESWVRLERSKIAARTAIAELPEGDWIVQTGHGQMPLRLTADTEIALHLRRYDCLELRRIAPGGKLAALGFRAGDKLIAIDGLTWESITELDSQRHSSLRKATTTWTLLRDGAQVTLTFEGREVLALYDEGSDYRERPPTFMPAFREP